MSGRGGAPGVGHSDPDLWSFLRITADMAIRNGAHPESPYMRSLYALQDKYDPSGRTAPDPSDFDDTSAPR